MDRTRADGKTGRTGPRNAGARHAAAPHPGARALALPAQAVALPGRARAGRPAGVVRDLRGRRGHSPHELRFGPSDVVVVSGLPGSGKSTLIRRAVRGTSVDSQDSRARWAARVPRLLPYAVYRPLVRLAHYTALHRALTGRTGVVVHDCGTLPFVRGWLARAARRRGGTLHLLLLDVAPGAALDGQRSRGRGVSRYAFRRHRRSAARLLRTAARGELPPGCGSAVLLDRDAADTLRRIGFAEPGT